MQNGARRSDNVFEAVSVITGQPLASAAATEFLAMRSLEINVPFLLRAGATSLRTGLALDCFHTIGIEALLAFATELFEVHLVTSRNAPHISTLPSGLAVFTVEIAVLLLQELESCPAARGCGFFLRRLRLPLGRWSGRCLAVLLLPITIFCLLLLRGGCHRLILLMGPHSFGQREEAAVQHRRVEGHAPTGTEANRAERAAGGQCARTKRALHSSIGPGVHLHPDLPGVGSAEPWGQSWAHLRQQGLQVGPAVAVQVFRGQRGGGPPEEGTEPTALALLPAGLLQHWVPATAWCRATPKALVPKALVGAEWWVDKALHGCTCREVSSRRAPSPAFIWSWRDGVNCC